MPSELKEFITKLSNKKKRQTENPNQTNKGTKPLREDGFSADFDQKFTEDFPIQLKVFQKMETGT